MLAYTFYKGVFTPKQLKNYLNKTGDLPECESFKKKEKGDDKKIKDFGYIAEESFDDDLYNDLPETLSECI